MFYVSAKYDYAPSSVEEMGFNQGDVIAVVETDVSWTVGGLPVETS